MSLMSTYAVTPTPKKGVATPLPTATTRGSTQLHAHNNLFELDLMLQDMIKLSDEWTDILFGDDDRSRKKLKPNYRDHIKSLNLAHTKMQESFKLLGISSLCLLVMIDVLC